jgi:DNA-binding response OmpR family regulator
LIKDNDSDARLYAAMLQELQADTVDNPTATPTDIERVAALEPGLAELTDREQTYDAVLLDLNLPDSTGLETVDRVVDADSDVAIVVLTSVGDQRLGTEAVDKGAQDFLIKDHVTPRVLAKLDAVRLGVVLDAEVTRFRENYESVSVSFTGDVSDVSVKANQFLGTVLRNVLLNAVDHNDND